MIDARSGRLQRPSPYALLAHAERESGARGRLKIFLGAAPGVGKTYEMLMNARAKKRDGVDVVAGVIETHGRTETEAPIDGLEILPRREISYKGSALGAFDLDALIARHPTIALVDELAHTNAPGSRHPKRYQDVEVIEAADGRSALAGLDRDTVDLVILDLGLPDTKGHELLRAVRAHHADMPVVVLSSRDDETGKVEAFDLGADDYVTKPFGMNELLARLRAALRHQLAVQGERPVFKVEDLSVDLVRRHVRMADREIKLSPKEYDVLRLLVLHAGRVPTHAYILREVWGGSTDPQYLRVYVRQIRQKLEPAPDQPHYILTETGIGYRLRAPDETDH